MYRPRPTRAYTPLILSVLALAAACGDDPIVLDPGSISGTVTAEGEPLGAVQVSLTGSTSRQTTTDASGGFSFSAVDPGTWTLSVDAGTSGASFAPPSRTVSVGAGEAATADLDGTWIRTASIAGSVRADAQPLEGVTVTATGPEAAAATTDEAGTYRLEGLRAGTYSVSIAGVDPDQAVFETTTEQVALEVGAQHSVDFEGRLVVLATARLVAIELVSSGERLGFGQLRDNMEVVVSIEAGTQTVEAVRVTLDGDVVGEVDLTTGAGAAAPERVRVPLNTLEVDATTGQPRIANGTATLGLWLVTAEDGARQEAEAEQVVTIENSDRVAGFTFLTGDEWDGVVSQFRRWYGNRDLDFRILPVIYSRDLTIGSVEVQAISTPSVNGGPGLDFGSGPGVPHRVFGPDFLFTATNAANQGVVEDRASGSGHRIVVTRVFDDAGVDISDQVAHTEALERLYFDFVGPVAGGGAEILVDGASVVAGALYSSGEVTLGDVVEAGVGGNAYIVDAYVGVERVRGIVERVGEVTERQAEVHLEVREMQDLLGNPGDPAAVPATVLFGIDEGPIEVEGLPTGRLVLNPDDDDADGAADNGLMFTLDEPLLLDGTAGAGLGPLSLIVEDDQGTETDLTAQIVPAAIGANTATLPGLLQQVYSVRFHADDAAIPGNRTSVDFEILIDSTDPVVDLINPPPASVNVTGDLGFTLAGEATDENGVSEVLLSVRDAGANTTCEAADALIAVGTAPGQIDRNEIVVDDPGDFSELFKIFDGGVGTQQIVCFWVDVADQAMGSDGELEPNRTAEVVRTVIDWN